MRNRRILRYGKGTGKSLLPGGNDSLTMKRIVQPEILDSLPQDHPDAAANRRDLRLINGIMGNSRWFERTLSARLAPADRVVEIGAGTGELGNRLRRRCRIAPAAYCGLDFWSRPGEWPADWEWEQANLLHFNRYGEFSVLLANLILHQFVDEELKELGARVRAGNLRLIMASEPARRRTHQWQLRVLRPLGLHPVSRHDAHVSIDGGFRGSELPDLLGLREPEWEIHCDSGFLGWNRLVAVRREKQDG